MLEYDRVVDLPPNTPEALKELLVKKGMPEPDFSKGVDDNTLQRTVVLQERPKILIVSANDPTVLIDRYEDLPEFPISELSDLERATLSDIEKKIKYNGDNILLKDISFEEGENTLYLHAVRAPYSVVNALSTNKIKTKEFYFKTGVMVPLVTSDKKVVFLERNHPNPMFRFFSAPAGFLQPVADNRLSFSTDKFEADFVMANALKELSEEVFSEAGQLNAIQFFNSFGISIRYFSNASAPTCEFITPVKVEKTAEELVGELKNNRSIDAKEHTDNYFIFDGSSPELARESLKLVGAKLGFFLYWPMLQTIYPGLSSKCFKVEDVEENSMSCMRP